MVHGYYLPTPSCNITDVSYQLYIIPCSKLALWSIFMTKQANMKVDQNDNAWICNSKVQAFNDAKLYPLLWHNWCLFQAQINRLISKHKPAIYIYIINKALCLTFKDENIGVQIMNLLAATMMMVNSKLPTLYRIFAGHKERGKQYITQLSTMFQYIIYTYVYCLNVSAKLCWL